MSAPGYLAAQLKYTRRLFALLLVGLAVPTLACGTFATRFPIDSAMPESDITPTIPISTSTPITIPTPSPLTPVAVEQGLGGSTLETSIERVPTSSVDLEIGERARIIAGAGINIREGASRTSPVISRLGYGTLVRVRDGPFRHEDLYWWQVESLNEQWRGMVAEGLPDEPWLEAAPGAVAPVDRDPVAGDRGVVSIARLNLRASPALNATVVEILTENREFTVLEGPLEREGYTWFQIRLTSGEQIGWAVVRLRDNQRALTPLE